MTRLVDSSGLTSYALVGGYVDATVSANALTVSLKTSSGNIPSQTEPMYIALRSDPTSAAKYTGYTIAYPVSVTISPGSTLGVAANSRPFRLWVMTFYDSSSATIKLLVVNFENPVFDSFKSVTENLTLSVIADNGSGNADSYQVYYSNAAASATSYRFVGMLDWDSGLATIGTWDTAPDVRLYKNGMPLSGEVVSTALVPLTAASNFTDLIPDDDTQPLYAEGKDLFGTINFLLAYPVNYLLIEAQVFCTRSLASNIILAAFSQNQSLIGVGWQSVRAADDRVCVRLTAKKQKITFGNIMIGGDIAGTTYVNSISTGRKFGGFLTSSIRLTEIML